MKFGFKFAAKRVMSFSISIIKGTFSQDFRPLFILTKKIFQYDDVVKLKEV